jgi:two-component system NarL family response regulator
LIVEDHAVFCEALTARIDRETDLRVVGSVSTCAQVLPAVATTRPDIVLLDIELGNDLGTEIIEELTKDLRAPKVVVLTCRTDSATAMAAISKGASAFVHKAATMEELLFAIHTAAAGEIWVSPTMLSRMLPALIPSNGRAMADNRLLQLTDREREVLVLMVNGLPNSAIAERLHLSIHTVRTHVHNLQKKLNVHSKLAAVAVAHSVGIQPA